MYALIEAGGPVMWPLIILSIAILAVILDRTFAFLAVSLPDGEMERALIDASDTDRPSALAKAGETFPALHDAFTAMAEEGRAVEKETRVTLAIEGIVHGLDRRVGFLGMAGRIAPLLGLLGTIIGMIATFSQLASTEGAVDMTLLADGIWQALLTTATGLTIAIPAVVAQLAFQRREERIAYALARLANLVMIGRAPGAPRAAAAVSAQTAPNGAIAS